MTTLPAEVETWAYQMGELDPITYSVEDFYMQHQLNYIMSKFDEDKTQARKLMQKRLEQAQRSVLGMLSFRVSKAANELNILHIVQKLQRKKLEDALTLAKSELKKFDPSQ